VPALVTHTPCASPLSKSAFVACFHTCGPRTTDFSVAAAGAVGVLPPAPDVSDADAAAGVAGAAAGFAGAFAGRTGGFAASAASSSPTGPFTESATAAATSSPPIGMSGISPVSGISVGMFGGIGCPPGICGAEGASRRSLRCTVTTSICRPDITQSAGCTVFTSSRSSRTEDDFAERMIASSDGGRPCSVSPSTLTAVEGSTRRATISLLFSRSRKRFIICAVFSGGDCSAPDEAMRSAKPPNEIVDGAPPRTSSISFPVGAFSGTRSFIDVVTAGLR